MYFYLFHWANAVIPNQLKGSSADPSTFMNARERSLSENYSNIRNFMFFLSTPYEWLFYLFYLIGGWSLFFEKWARAITKRTYLRFSIYLFFFLITSFIAFLPFDILSYHFSRKFGISTQNVSSWMKDEWIDFWVNGLTMFVVMGILIILFKKFPRRWWLAAWGLSIPLAVFLIFIQPVVIDPLYNQFDRLKDHALETKILALANRAHIPADRVYEVDMSSKTNALNAYVTGLGGNSRIVLWDTTLNKLTDEEILFVMAHEMSHYVQKDVVQSLALSILMTFIGFWIIAKWIAKILKKRYETTSKRQGQFYFIPLFFLLSSLLLFAASPLSNGFSRFQEERADMYAIALTKDHEAAISAFQKLTKTGLSEVNPPWIVKVFRYSHPTMLERLDLLEHTKE